MTNPDNILPCVRKALTEAGLYDLVRQLNERLVMDAETIRDLRDELAYVGKQRDKALAERDPAVKAARELSGIVQDVTRMALDIAVTSLKGQVRSSEPAN